MSFVRNRGPFIWISVLLFCVSATAQQKILWQGVVKPEAINVYQSSSTKERVTATLRQGDTVDVVLQISVSGSKWCRVSRTGTSEPLGFVLCLHLELGGSSPEQVVHAQQIGTKLHPLETVAAPSPVPSGSTRLTNRDVLDLHKAGLNDQVLVAKIKLGQTNFDTSPSQLKELKAAGLADSVILAMVEASTAQSPAPGDPSLANPSNAAATTVPEALRTQPGARAVRQNMPLASTANSATTTQTEPASAQPPAPAQAPAPAPRPNDGKVRLYVTDEPKDESIFLAAHRSGWQVNGNSSGYVSGSGGSAGAAYGYSQKGADPRTVELQADLYKTCPSIIVTNDPARADYALLFRREGGKRSSMFIFGGLTGLAISAHSKVDGASVFNTNGDMVFATRARTMGTAIKEVCAHMN